MNTSTITQYISDTVDNILSSSPSSNRIGVASDTGELFISDGIKWYNHTSTGMIDQQQTLSTGTTISQTPMLSFDASVSSSLSNHVGDTPVADEPISSWRSDMNTGNFIETRAINQPVYKTNITPRNNPGIMFDGISNMSLDRGNTSITGLPLTIFTVYTPTRDSKTIRQFDGVSSQTQPGGYYSKNMLGNHINHVWSNRILRNRSVTYTRGAVGLMHTHSNAYIYNYTASHINQMLQLPQYNTVSSSIYHDNLQSWNDNFLGKTQIHVCKIAPVDTTRNGGNNNAGAPLIDVVNTWLTWNPGSDTKTYTWDSSYNYGDIGYCLAGLQLGNQSSYNTLHEFSIYNHSLSQSEINSKGEHLFNKWCHTDQTLLKHSRGYNI